MSTDVQLDLEARLQAAQRRAPARLADAKQVKRNGRARATTYEAR